MPHKSKAYMYVLNDKHASSVKITLFKDRCCGVKWGTGEKRLRTPRLDLNASNKNTKIKKLK